MGLVSECFSFPVVQQSDPNLRYDKRPPCMTATTGFSVQTQLSRSCTYRTAELWPPHGAAAAAPEESRDGLSQRRVPPVLGPSDYQYPIRSAHGRPHGHLSGSEVGRDGELMQYIGRGCDTRLDRRGEGRREDARRTNT